MALSPPRLRTFEILWADGRVEKIKAHYVAYGDGGGGGSFGEIRKFSTNSGGSHIRFDLSGVGVILSVRQSDVTSVRLIEIEDDVASE